MSAFVAIAGCVAQEFMYAIARASAIAMPALASAFP
jgi:hypothetical protein